MRIIPRNPYSTLVLADGTTTECLVKDVSASGIAVSADIVPPIGTAVAVGKVVGRVVRHFEDGFAVQFAQLQELDTVEELIARLRLSRLLPNPAPSFLQSTRQSRDRGSVDAPAHADRERSFTPMKGRRSRTGRIGCAPSMNRAARAHRFRYALLAFDLVTSCSSSPRRSCRATI